MKLTAAQEKVLKLLSKGALTNSELYSHGHAAKLSATASALERRGLITRIKLRGEHGWKLKQSKRSFGRKVYPSLPEKDNDRLRRLARDLAAAKAELKRIKRQRPKPKKPKSLPNQPTTLEKAAALKRLKQNVKYLPNTAAKIEALNAKLAELNGSKIKVALSESPDRLARLAEIEEQAIAFRKKRYRLSRPYFSERLIEFRTGHVNGIDSFIHACKTIGMTEREAYTLWYSPK